MIQQNNVPQTKLSYCRQSNLKVYSQCSVLLKKHILTKISLTKPKILLVFFHFRHDSVTPEQSSYCFPYTQIQFDYSREKLNLKFVGVKTGVKNFLPNYMSHFFISNMIYIILNLFVTAKTLLRS